MTGGKFRFAVVQTLVQTEEAHWPDSISQSTTETARAVKFAADQRGQSVSEFVRRAVSVQVGAEAGPYRFSAGTIRDPSFIRDLAAVQGWSSGERPEIDEAMDRLRTFEQWSADSPLSSRRRPRSSASAVFPTGYKAAVTIPMTADRPLASATDILPISSSQPFTVPRHTSGGTVHAARTEGSQPTEVDLVFATASVVPRGLAGMLNLTRELVDSASPGGDVIALQIMREDWFAQAEALIYTALNDATTGAGGVITAGFVPSGAQARVSTTPATNLLIDLKKAILEYGNVRRRKARSVVVGNAALTHLGGLLGAEAINGDDTALFNLFGARVNAATTDFGTAAGDMRIAILGSDDVVSFESPLAEFRFDETAGPALVRCSVWGYFAVVVARPSRAWRASGSRRPEEEQMRNVRILFGPEHPGKPSANSPEAAAQEFFTNRQLMGDFTPRPAIERWIQDQRERFEAEMRRLEAERVQQISDAVAFAARREL